MNIIRAVIYIFDEKLFTSFTNISNKQVFFIFLGGNKGEGVATDKVHAKHFFVLFTFQSILRHLNIKTKNT